MMPRLVSRQRVMVLAVTLACTMAAVTTLINGALLDRQIDQRSIVLNLIQVLGLGFCLSYLMGLKLMQLTLASQKLEQIASYDFLTDALTRARFFAQIAAQPNLRGAFLIFDMNDFKRINDTLGHAAGDHVLAEVASLLRASVRGADLVARVGKVPLSAQEIALDLAGAFDQYCAA